MENNLIKIKKEVRLFLIITFVITFSMGLVMFFALKNNNEIDAGAFGLVQMFYPALAAIIAKIYYDKENIPKDLRKFFNIYIGISVIAVGVLILGIFVFPTKTTAILNGFIMIVSVITFIMIIIGQDTSYEKISMVFTKNFKTVAILSLLFVGLKIIMILFSGFIYGGLSEVLKELMPKIIVAIVTLPLVVIFSFIIFFGEELGWREYLQVRLQILFGKKIGVIILGFIWGIWHLPLCFMLYSPATPIYCVITHVFFCIFLGIFLGFVYMKTKNLWSVMIIHSINNSIAVSANNGEYAQVITSMDLIWGVIICAIVFLPFIFTKEYKGEIKEIQWDKEVSNIES